MNNWYSKITLLTIGLLLFAITAYAQQHTVSGTVTDAQTDKPVIGVNILVAGTSTGTATDADGHYSLNVPSLQDSLRFTYIGYKTKTVPIDGRTTINIALKPTIISGQQLVVIGYGKQKRSDITGSLGTVSTQQLEQSSPLNVQGALKGKIAGVHVVQASGRPGGNPRIRIRGFTSITGSNSPLYVVDGVIINSANLSNGTNPISYLNPQTIESITVLKDASATAIYGARGANGVIVINTKSNESGHNIITYSGSVDVGTLQKKIDVLNSKQFMKLERVAYQNAEKFGLEKAAVDPAIKIANRPKLFDSEGKPRYNTNWQEAATRTAISNNQHLTFGGGDNETNYIGGLGYKNENGLLSSSNYKSYSGHFSVNSKINDWITAGGLITYSYANQSMPRNVGASGVTVTRQLIQVTPVIPIKYPNGEYARSSDYPGMEGMGNPVEYMKIRGRDLLTSNLIGNAHINLDLLKGLSFESNLGVNMVNQKLKYFAAPNMQFISVFGTAELSSENHKSWQFETQLNYETSFSENQSFKVLLATSWQKVKSFSFGTGVSEINTNFFKYNNLGAASKTHIPSSGKSLYSLNSYFTRINYSLNDTYLFTLTGRIDGSSNFSKMNQYGFFPSAAFAWNISNEEFLESNSVISNLKLRFSYGITGNSNIPNYRTVTGLRGYSYIINGKLVSGVGAGTLANSELKWERDIEADIGIDLGLFNGRLSFTGDIYYKRSQNMLLNAPIPLSSGYGRIIKNIGDMENRGLELSLSTINVRNSNFNWSTNFNLSMNRSKVLFLVGGQDILGPRHTIIREGEPVNSFYGYVILKAWGTDQKKQAAKYDAIPGDLRIKDVNDDGKINRLDEKIIGNGLPKGYGALINTFNYKNFHLLVNLTYTFGNDVMWYSKINTTDRTGVDNTLTHVLKNAWTPNNQNTEVPQIRPTPGYINVAKPKSTWIYDGSHIRVERVLLSYNFSQKVINKLDMSKLRVYVAADNLFLISSYPGYDPEVSGSNANFTQGIDVFSYPKPRTFQFGLTFSF